MCQTVKHLILHVRDNFSRVFVSRMIEWEHAIGLFLFGLVLVMQPGLLWKAPGYAAFKTIHDSPSFWAISAMLVGATRFVILFYNGTISRSPHLRAGAAMLSAAFWLYAGLGSVIAGTLSPVTFMYLSFVAWEFVIFIICVRYAKLEDIGAVNRVVKHNP